MRCVRICGGGSGSIPQASERRYFANNCVNASHTTAYVREVRRAPVREAFPCSSSKYRLSADWGRSGRLRARRALIRSVLEHDVHLFRVEPPSQTCTGRSPLASRRRRSECRGRDAKCVGNAPLSSRSGRIASGITWRRRRGAVLGSPHARAPKVSPKMVGPLSRGNDFGGNPQEGGNNTSLSRERNLPN